MSCPNPAVLSDLAHDALRQSRRREVEAHVARCVRCSEALAADRVLASAFTGLTCPDAETLAAFVDDALPAERLERTAAHVLVCDPCRDVVAWVREAQAADLGRSTSRRRRSLRRVQRPGARTGPAPWLGAVAAAAAVLLVVALGLPGTPPSGQPGREQARRTEPTPTPAPAPPAPLAPAPEQPLPQPEVTAEVDAPATPEEPSEPLLPEPIGPEAQPREPESAQAPPASSTGEVAPPPPPAIALAAASPSAEQDLEWLRPDGVREPLGDRRELPAGSRLVARRTGSVRVGDVACTLAAQAEVILAPGGLELARGEVVVDAGPAARAEVGCGEARVRVAAQGGRYQAAVAGRGFLLVVVDGGAELQVGDRREALAAGEGREVSGGRIRPAPEARLVQAHEQAALAAIALGTDVPRGLATHGALGAAARALGGDLPARAEALWTLAAVAAGDARLARGAHVHADAAAEARTLLAARSARTLAADGAAAPLILARLVQGELDPASRDRVAELTEALAARPPQELAADADRLLALRAGSRAAGVKLPRGLWSAVGSALVPAAPAHDLARALLVQPRQDPATVRAGLETIDADLARDPLVEPLAADLLARIELALALVRGLTAERLLRLEAHATFAPREPALARALAGASALALGIPAPERAPASAVAVPAGDAFRVTFRLRPTRRGARQVTLCGSWNDWDEAATPLRRLSDGSFVATLTLPAGRHAYKLRLGEHGKTWEIDAANPLREADGRGGENSVLVLE